MSGNPVDEASRRRFESAWRSGGLPPLIEDFLPPPDDPLRAGTIEELAHIDLEFAWRSGTTPRRLVETYVARFPQLAGETVARRLAAQEYRVRSRYAERPSESEYAARFPHLFADGRIAEELGAYTTATFEEEAESEIAAPAELPGYEVVRVVGRGGMGVVFEARDVALKRAVAIKVPLRGRLGRSEAERFLREARAVAKLRHANICPIYEVGEHRKRPYIAMGFVAGTTLSEWARARPRTARECAEMIGAVARAVAYAHDHGVVHRDIKPANVLVEAESGAPVLTDFGLAKEFTASEQTAMTQDGTLLGTPMYMSPEQAAGRVEEVGPATDVYSLGVVLYELLCGRPPFAGTAGEILKQVQGDPIVPLRRRAPAVHRDLETICLKALARQPKERYTAGELAADLGRFAAGEAILARREGLLRRGARVLRRHPRQAAAFAAVLALAVATIAVSTWASARTREAAGVRQQIEARIDTSGPWTAARVGEVEGMIGQLAALDAAQGEAQRGRLRRALEQSIEGLLRQPALTADVQARLDEQVALLSARAPGRAVELADAVAKRRRAWEPVFLLEAPFSDLRKWPHYAVVRVEGRELVYVPPQNWIQSGYGYLTFPEPCRGNAQMEVVLSGDWARSPMPMLCLGTTGSWSRNRAPPTGYSFWVNHPDDRVDITKAARSPDGTVTAGCARDGVVLRTWNVRASALVGRPLRLMLRREGRHLTMRVNDLPAMEVEDAFVPSPREPSRFMAFLPPGARLERVRADRQAQAVAPSPLERGDALFQANQFAEALACYREQAVGSTSEAGQEARYKQGLCLVALKSDGEAAALFEPLFEEKGERWPPLAGCQLLAMRKRQNRPAEADAVFRTLSGRYSPAQLRPLIGQDVRRTIIGEATRRTFGLHTFSRMTPDTVEELRQTHEMVRLLDPGDLQPHHSLNLLRAYELAGMDQEALRLAAELFAEPPGLTMFSAYEHYGTIMRGRKQAGAALQQVDARLLDQSRRYQPDVLTLLVERARLQVAAGDATRAERDLDDYLKLSEGAWPRYYEFDGSAALMRGILRQERGDAAGAMADFRWGTLRAFTARHATQPATAQGWIHGLQGATVALICGAMAGELSDLEIEELVRSALVTMNVEEGKVAQGSSSLNAYWSLYRSGLIDVPASTLREMWLTPRGRRMARESAFRTMPLAESARQTMGLGIYQMFRQGCLSGEPSAEEDAALWEVAMMSCDAARERNLAKDQFLKLFLSWKGITGVLGWGGVRGTLEPGYRAGMAYVFGKRCLMLGKREEALGLFTEAEAEAGESRVGRLAREELGRMRAKK